MKELLNTEILQQALELNGIDSKKTSEIAKDYTFLLAAEELLKRAEEKKGKKVKDKEGRKELRKLLSAKLKAEGEILAYKLFKEEGLL